MVIDNQLQGGSADIIMDHRKNFLPIGYIRNTDSKVHIGNNQWMESAIWQNLIVHSKSPQMFVGNIFMTIFGEEILLHSTISGKASNKSKSKNVDKPAKLDPAKLSTCQDLYTHWLKNEYGKICEDFDIFSETSNFWDYGSKKIAYLKREAKPKTGVKRAKSKNAQESEDSDEEEKKPKKRRVGNKKENIKQKNKKNKSKQEQNSSDEESEKDGNQPLYIQAMVHYNTLNDNEKPPEKEEGAEEKHHQSPEHTTNDVDAIQFVSAEQVKQDEIANLYEDESYSSVSSSSAVDPLMDLDESDSTQEEKYF